ncbi:MAG: hypothetical protein ACLTSX_09280 [Collinsella sp.]
MRAQADAIKVFAKNTEGLLQQRPVRGARVIALDPGYRAGCKVAVLDEYGKLLDHTILYPTPPRRDIAGTKRELLRLTRKHRINTIVVGNGTASRETEEVVFAFIAESAPELRYTIVNEAGASVYSASKLASEEYPDLDVTTRGAMSLGRRLQDPWRSSSRSRRSPSASASTSTTSIRPSSVARWATWWRTWSIAWAWT